jgi:lipopolysaccharide transport system ATP-binding protein
MRPAIRVDNLSKLYRIGTGPRGPSRDLRETIVNKVRELWGRLRGRKRGGDGQDQPRASELWALRDVSFEVQPGEVVGVIGRNGAGKSTLLKILSRIVEPTTGRAEMRGRVSSLLEVGTGFHPELTGRDNIYLNGSILGMTRKEIDRKFDEIVAFSEIEKFLGTPVKRYSSGMYVRLAFAVAAHLEPDILVVDEVLAVGDAAFQEKCLGKLKDVGREGRTVLFVSHNLVAIRQLCRSGLWIDAGRLKQSGPVSEIVTAYSRKHAGQPEGVFAPSSLRGDGRVELLSYQVTDGSGCADRLPTTNGDVVITVRCRVQGAIRQPACGVNVINEHGVLMTCLNTVEQGVVLEPLPAGEAEVTVRLRKAPYIPGRYTASFWVMSPQGHIHVLAEDSIPFKICQSALYGTREIDYRYGCVYTDVTFSWTPVPSALADPTG